MKNKLITATLLKGWASKRESQSIMPELIKRLIISSGAKVRKMSIPSGDNVYIPGWDGQVSSDSPIFNVSAGISLWEIVTITDFTLHFSCCFTKLLHSLFITLLNNFTM